MNVQWVTVGHRGEHVNKVIAFAAGRFGVNLEGSQFLNPDDGGATETIILWEVRGTEDQIESFTNDMRRARARDDRGT